MEQPQIIARFKATDIHRSGVDCSRNRHRNILLQHRGPKLLRDSNGKHLIIWPIMFDIWLATL